MKDFPLTLFREIRVASKVGVSQHIKRETLSEEDQTFITAWITDKVPDIEVYPNFDRGLTKDRNKYSPASRQTFGMRVEIRNYSSDKALEESEIIFYLIGLDFFLLSVNAPVLLEQVFSAQLAGFEALGETMGVIKLVRISGHPEKLGCPYISCRLAFEI
ncbi:MAG: hypothetical protein ACJAT6_000540 [Akkermansiaceae bacterium]